jgi:C4-type Zn-finger protein
MENSEQKKEHGLDCPVCRFHIKFTIEDLVTKKHIICPSCNLTLDLDVSRQMKKDPGEILLVEKMKRQFGISSNKSKNETKN